MAAPPGVERELNALLGREEELVMAARLLVAARMVTITGGAIPGEARWMICMRRLRDGHRPQLLSATNKKIDSMLYQSGGKARSND
jgi:hypothetical protein